MGFAVEDRLLIRCSQVAMSDDTLAKVSSLLQHDIDWTYVLEASMRHGVSPLFYHGLMQAGQTIALEQSVPGYVLKRLRQLFEANRARNRRLYQVINELFEAFGQAGIAAIGLKDIQLAHDVYPDIGLRPMGDIDILIHERDYERTATCMATLGFVPLPHPQLPFTLKYAWGHHFHRARDNTWVDLQWNVCQIEWDVCHEGNFDFEIDRVWRNAVPMITDDQQILVPCPEDMLFHLCLHLEGHYYAELILFCDIVELLRDSNDQLDWAYIVDLARKYKVESTVYYVLTLVYRLFGIAPPPFVFQHLEPRYFKASIFEALFGNLTRLHLLLDDINRVAAPPDTTIRKFEVVVRQQAISAMHAYREIDRMVESFLAQAGQLIVMDGVPSERIFPVSALSPFEKIRVFILSKDAPIMQQVLSNCHFQQARDGDRELHTKEWTLTTRDPVLAHLTMRIVMQIEFFRDGDALFHYDTQPSPSTRAIALRLLRSHLTGNTHSSPAILIPVVITVLSPEELVLYFSARLGRKSQNCLVELVKLLEIFRQHTGPIDLDQVIRQAEYLGISAEVEQGLRAIGEVLENRQLHSPLLTRPTSPPHMLEWARYGPDSLNTRTSGFRALFLYVISLLTVDGLAGKIGYLLRSTVWPKNRTLILPTLVWQSMKSLLAFPRIHKAPNAGLVFWIEPASLMEAEVENS